MGEIRYRLELWSFGKLLEVLETVSHKKAGGFYRRYYFSENVAVRVYKHGERLKIADAEREFRLRGRELQQGWVSGRTALERGPKGDW